jgi:hypothetical protein
MPRPRPFRLDSATGAFGQLQSMSGVGFWVARRVSSSLIRIKFENQDRFLPQSLETFYDYDCREHRCHYAHQRIHGRTIESTETVLGHTKLESTVRYLGIEVDDALEMAEQTEV